MFTTHSLSRVIATSVATLVVTASGLVGSNVTQAQAAVTGPSVTVSGKYCPKAGSVWKRHMHISSSAKAGSKICTVEENDASNGVDLNATIKFTKSNDYRFNAKIQITPYAYEYHESRDGMTQWWIYAWADSAYISGQGRFTMDELGTAYYFNVPGKSFKVSVRWYMETTTRYWDKAQRGFVKSTVKGYRTMKAVKFTAVTRTK